MRAGRGGRRHRWRDRRRNGRVRRWMVGATAYAAGSPWSTPSVRRTPGRGAVACSECMPVTTSSTTRTRTTATAAAGAASRRGRLSMPCMARSSVPVMKLDPTCSDPTVLWPFVARPLFVVEAQRLRRLGRWWRRRRWHDRPARFGQADRRRSGHTKSAGRVGGVPVAVRAVPLRLRRVGPHLFERVQRAVVVLHGVDLVARTGAYDGGRDHAQHDRNGDDPTDQHCSYSTGSAARVFDRDLAWTPSPLLGALSPLPGARSPVARGPISVARGPISVARSGAREVRPARVTGGGRAGAGRLSRRLGAGCRRESRRARGRSRSRPDRIGSLTPQSAPTAGSSQARPSSSAGS